MRQRGIGFWLRIRKCCMGLRGRGRPERRGAGSGLEWGTQLALRVVRVRSAERSTEGLLRRRSAVIFRRTRRGTGRRAHVFPVGDEVGWRPRRSGAPSSLSSSLRVNQRSHSGVLRRPQCSAFLSMIDDAAAGLDHAAHFGDGAIDFDGVLQGFGGVGGVEGRGGERQLGHRAEPPVACRRERSAAWPRRDVEREDSRRRGLLSQQSPGEPPFAAADVEHAVRRSNRRMNFKMTWT